MGRRNWCSVGLHEPTGELVFDLRVEKEKGRGYTIGYDMTAGAYRGTNRLVPILDIPLTFLHPAGL
jgi:hypothetical protein